VVPLPFAGDFMDSSSSRTKCSTEGLKTSQRKADVDMAINNVTWLMKGCAVLVEKK